MKTKVSGLFVAAAGLAAFVLAGPGQAGLAGEAERFDALRVGAGSLPVKDLRLTSGHLNLLLKSGSVTPVRAGSELVGLFFQGSGSLEYQSVDPIEFPVMAFNIRKASGLTAEKAEKTLTVRDSFERLLWLSLGKPLPELPGGSEIWKADQIRVEASTTVGPSLESAFQKQQEKFRRVRGGPLSHYCVLQRLNSPSVPLVVAELDGGKEDLLYGIDEVEGKSESLLLLRKSESNDAEMRKFLFPVVLSDQPIGRDRRDPLLPLFLLTDVRLELIASDGKDAALAVVETVVPQGRSQSAFRFNLYNTNYARVGAGSLQPRTYRVKSVADESGKPLSYHHQGDEIVVAFPAPVEANQTAKLRFDIEGDFLIRPGGDNFWELGVEPWFPQPDFGGQFYTFHATVKVKKPFIAFAAGKTVSRRTEGDYAVVETEIDRPVQFAVVLAGKYEFEEETRNGVTIRVASYAGKNTRAMKQLTKLAFGIIEYYEKFLGPFPFPEFNILEKNEYGYGQAPPTVMFITKEAFNPLLGELNQLFSQGVNERFAHEIAHQYWAHVVKMPSPEEQWLTESFAEYSAAVFLKAFKGKATYETLLRHWKTRASSATDAAPIPLANRVSVPNDFLTRFTIRTGLIYDKGAYLLSVLHKELGDQMFLTFMKSYQKSFRWKFGSTKTVYGLLQWLTKKDYAPFFEANYWGTGMPAS